MQFLKIEIIAHGYVGMAHTNLDRGLGGVSVGRNLTRSSRLLVIINLVLATP
jgi:hypothetical protein